MREVDYSKMLAKNSKLFIFKSLKINIDERIDEKNTIAQGAGCL